MLKSRLGFSIMRLPVIGRDPTNFENDKLSEMVGRTASGETLYE